MNETYDTSSNLFMNQIELPKPKGGTQQMLNRLNEAIEELQPDLFDKIKIHIGKNDFDYNEIDENKINIYWIHDNSIDQKHLKEKENQDKFEAFVFVSSFQKNEHILTLGLPFEKCRVIYNAVEREKEYKEKILKEGEKFKFIYTSTPHRGLDVLYNAVEQLKKERTDFEVDIFSSYNIYGWVHMQEKNKDFFKMLRDHELINWYDVSPNEVVREHVRNAHCFVYPCVYQETYCLSMVEALMNGCYTIIPDYGALPEISARFAKTYQYFPDKAVHSIICASEMYNAMMNFDNEHLQNMLKFQWQYFNTFHAWENRKYEWISYLNYLCVVEEQHNNNDN